MSGGFATLDDFARVLAEAGYAVERRRIDEAGDVILAETPYALVACVEHDAWDDLEEAVSDTQTMLTHLAATVPSPRRWDLYLVVHVRTPICEPSHQAMVEAIEADTHYVRKFVRVCVRGTAEDLDRALRPLLPLRAAPGFDLVDPVDALRSELRDLHVEEALAAAALKSFEENDEVLIP